MAERRHIIEIEAFLAAASLALFALVTGVVLFHLVPPENEKYAMLLLGALIGIVKDTFARYFNVTKGGVEQRETIANMAKATADTAAVAAAAAPGAASTTVQAEGELTLTAPTPPKA